VTGANGFLGSRVVRRLIAHGETSPICLVRPGSNMAKLEGVSSEFPHASVRLRPGHLATIEAAQAALEEADTVYHLAASLRGSPADMVASTVVTSRNLLEAAIRMRQPPKIVLVSSFGVYGVAGLAPRTVIDETTPLETAPQKRDPYSQIKLRQEELFWQYRREHGLELIVLRPGAIIGPESFGISTRVGLQLGGVFLFLGGDNLFPISYVDNCADALIVAGTTPSAAGKIFNVHDDELPTCRTFLARYRRDVRSLRAIPIPYPVLRILSEANRLYTERSGGQLPAVFTPYKTESLWKPMRFDNSRLRALGWRQQVATTEALDRTFHRHRQHWQAAGLDRGS
jgi:nucleoside-diphosphate-sugar epimerase